jgi:uncharacterized protein YqiB (DUF1249 family)
MESQKAKIKMEVKKMRNVISKNDVENVERRFHVGNGVYSTRIVATVTYTLEVESEQIFACEYENGKLSKLEDVSDIYNLDGSEKF